MNSNRIVKLEQFKQFALSLLLCLLLSGCTQLDVQSTVTPSVSTPESTAFTTAVASLPDYLTAVWPIPGSTIKASEYSQTMNSAVQGGIGVQARIDLLYRYFSGENYGKMEYSEENTFVPQDRITLFVDGEKISQELLGAYALDAISIHDDTGKLLYSGVAQMDLSWSVSLTQGEHMVSMHIYNAEETKILEYDWNFKIISD